MPPHCPDSRNVAHAVPDTSVRAHMKINKVGNIPNGDAKCARPYMQECNLHQKTSLELPRKTSMHRHRGCAGKF